MTLLFSGVLHADSISKVDNNDDLNLGTSWIGGVAPGAGDVATWDAALAAGKSYSLGEDLTWGGISMREDPGGNVSFSGGNTLTLGASGIYKSDIKRTITFNNAVYLISDQTWDLSGDKITVRGVDLNTHTLTLTGAATKEFKGPATGPGTIITDNGWLNLVGQGSLPSDVDLVFSGNSNFKVDKDVVAWADGKPLAKSLTFFGAKNAEIKGSSKDHASITIQDQLAIGPGEQTKFQFLPQGGFHIELYSDRFEHFPNAGSVLFSGLELGCFSASEMTNSVNILFKTAPELERVDGATGATTLGILRGATVAVAHNESYGIGLATYDADKGVRLLDFDTEYTQALVEGEDAGNNVRLANIGGSQILSSHLTTPLTTVNSLSLDTSGAASNAGIELSGEEGSVLRLSSGILFASQSVTGTKDSTDCTTINLPLDFNGRQGFILNARTDGMSNGKGQPLTFNASPVNDGGNGIVFAGSGSAYLQWPAPTVFTGPVIINSGWFRITGSGNTDIIPSKLIIYGGGVQNHGDRIADTADIEIHRGSYSNKGGDTNSGNSGSETFRDLTMYGGSYTHGGGGGGTVTMRNATLLGGTMTEHRGSLATITGDMILSACPLNLISNGDSNRSGTRVVVEGTLTISNSLNTAQYVAINLGYSRFRNPAFVSVTNKVSVYGNAINTNGVIISRTDDSDSRTMLGELRLNGPVEFFIDDGAADVDFDVDASFADNDAVVGTLVKTGEGTLRMTASTNSLTGGITVNAGRLILNGGASNDVAIAAGAILAGNGNIEANLTFADNAVFQVSIHDETTVDPMSVSGTVTSTGNVSVPVANDLPNGEWKVMTAASFDADFVATNPRWAFYTRNAGTELWLTKALGTVLVIK